jgi:hypothetical protein
MILDLDVDIQLTDRADLGRKPSGPGGGCSCMASCCCCSGSHAPEPAGGFLDDRA